MLPHDPTLTTIHTTSVDNGNYLHSPQVAGARDEIHLGHTSDAMQRLFHDVIL